MKQESSQLNYHLWTVECSASEDAALAMMESAAKKEQKKLARKKHHWLIAIFKD